MAKTNHDLSSFQSLPEAMASFRYIADSARFKNENPYFYQGPLPPESESLRTNVEFETHYNIPVRDLRSKTKLLGIEEHGFQILHQPSKFAHNLQDSEHLKSYLLETNQLLKKELKADFVVCYDVKVRDYPHYSNGKGSSSLSSFERVGANQKRLCTMIKAI